MALRKRLPRKKEPVTLAGIHASRGVEAWYRTELQALVKECNDDMVREIRATWHAAPPKAGMAHDESPTDRLRRKLTEAGDKWQSKFNKKSEALARRFASKNFTTTQAQFMGALKNAGFTVKFKANPASMEAYGAVVGENINLIRNLGRETLDDIQGKVWSSVRAGHDMGQLSTELHDAFGMNWRRAALIARDQNNKAKAVIEATRRKELGIKEAIWQHSGGGVTPRPSHVKAGRDKVRYNIATGWYDPAARKYIWPGTEINCRCVSKAVIPGLDESFL